MHSARRALRKQGAEKQTSARSGTKSEQTLKSRSTNNLVQEVVGSVPSKEAVTEQLLTARRNCQLVVEQVEQAVQDISEIERETEVEVQRRLQAQEDAARIKEEIRVAIFRLSVDQRRELFEAGREDVAEVRPPRAEVPIIGPAKSSTFIMPDRPSHGGQVTGKDARAATLLGPADRLKRVERLNASYRQSVATRKNPMKAFPAQRSCRVEEQVELQCCHMEKPVELQCSQVEKQGCQKEEQSSRVKKQGYEKKKQVEEECFQVKKLGYQVRKQVGKQCSQVEKQVDEQCSRMDKELSIDLSAMLRDDSGTLSSPEDEYSTDEDFE